MKRLLTFCLAILFCLFFSGCYLDDFTSSEQNKQYDSAIKIFKEYLAKTDPNAKIKEVSSEKYLGENHQMQLTEFVSGEYQSGSKKLKFAVNTKTGDIYTSERADLYAAKTAALVNDMLGLQWTAVKPFTSRPGSICTAKSRQSGAATKTANSKAYCPLPSKTWTSLPKTLLKTKITP